MRVVVLGTGFGGLELTAMLSEALGNDLDLVLIAKVDTFVFGFSKLDVMFRRVPAAQVRHPYRDIIKPGVRLIQSTVRAIYGNWADHFLDAKTRTSSLGVMNRFPDLTLELSS